MGCALKKEKQFSTIDINEQSTYIFVLINRDQGLKKYKQRYIFSNSIPILGSIHQSTIISRRNKLSQPNCERIILDSNNINTSTQSQHKK